MAAETQSLNKVLESIDDINREDIRQEVVENEPWPKEYLYSVRASEILEKYWPDANELLKIAVRGHHIKRWSIARSEFAMDRKGYLQWRTRLKILHGDLLEGIMSTNGYAAEAIQQVKQMVMKNKLKTDEDTQTLEDVICLTFLEFYLEDFTQKHDRNKIISIIQKTWAKMSDKAHELALKINYSDHSGQIIKEALSS